MFQWLRNLRKKENDPLREALREFHQDVKELEDGLARSHCADGTDEEILDQEKLRLKRKAVSSLVPHVTMPNPSYTGNERRVLDGEMQRIRNEAFQFLSDLFRSFPTEMCNSNCSLSFFQSEFDRLANMGSDIVSFKTASDLIQDYAAGATFRQRLISEYSLWRDRIKQIFPERDFNQQIADVPLSNRRSVSQLNEIKARLDSAIKHVSEKKSQTTKANDYFEKFKDS